MTLQGTQGQAPCGITGPRSPRTRRRFSSGRFFSTSSTGGHWMPVYFVDKLKIRARSKSGTAAGSTECEVNR